MGSCGPRGFYGTVDVHLELEKEIAAFMEADAAIIYSFDMASGSSVIPAFANQRDILVCDEAVHYPLQNGCNLSRARIEMFKHNDMDDLERVLKKIKSEEDIEKYVYILKQRCIASVNSRSGFWGTLSFAFSVFHLWLVICMF